MMGNANAMSGLIIFCASAVAGLIVVMFQVEHSESTRSFHREPRDGPRRFIFAQRHPLEKNESVVSVPEHELLTKTVLCCPDCSELHTEFSCPLCGNF